MAYADYEFYQRINKAGYGFNFIDRVICNYDINSKFLFCFCFSSFFHF